MGPQQLAICEMSGAALLGAQSFASLCVSMPTSSSSVWRAVQHVLVKGGMGVWENFSPVEPGCCFCCLLHTTELWLSSLAWVYWGFDVTSSSCQTCSILAGVLVPFPCEAGCCLSRARFLTHLRFEGLGVDHLSVLTGNSGACILGGGGIRVLTRPLGQYCATPEGPTGATRWVGAVYRLGCFLM